MSSQKIKDLFHTYIGHLLVIGFLVGGYVYNIKFIQVGIPYLGKQVLHVDTTTMGIDMALLAIITAVIAIAWGFRADKLHLTIRKRIDILIIVGIVQMVLTAWAWFMIDPSQLLPWIVCTSIVLGIGIPVSFPLVFELIPRKDRGIVAGLTAGLAFFVGNISPFPWTIAGLAQEALMMMVPGLAAFVVIRLLGFIAKWFPEKNDYSNYTGRFTSHSISWVVGLMFAIFFVDSLGFLRILAEPTLYIQTWAAPVETRWILGVVHLFAGIGAGILYAKSDEWKEGILALVLFIIADIAFSFYLPPPLMSSDVVLTIASLYCATVSIYTAINFAIWADLSTHENATKIAALGIGIGGWLSSFLSTTAAELLEPAVTFQVHLLLPAIISAVMLVLVIYLLKCKRELILGKTSGG